MGTMGRIAGNPEGVQYKPSQLNPFRVLVNPLFIYPAFHAGLFIFDPVRVRGGNAVCGLWCDYYSNHPAIVIMQCFTAFRHAQ